MFGDNHRYSQANYYLLLLYNCVANDVYSLISKEKTVAGWVNRRHGG
jgi:hypothetical protein